MTQSNKAQFRSDVHVELIDSMGDETSIVRAARVSTTGAGSVLTKGENRLLQFLYREKHGVPFEACVLQFYIEAPIFVTRQILKHRLSSINEESGRYRELDGVFYVPGTDRKVLQVGKTGDYEFVADRDALTSAQKWIRRASKLSWLAYRQLIRRGVSKEVSRMVLPVNLYSSLYMTMNLRAALNFVSLRVDWGEDAAQRSHPQHEIEQVGLAIALAIADQYPTVWQSFTESGFRPV